MAVRLAREWEEQCALEGEPFPDQLRDLATYIAKQWNPSARLLQYQLRDKPSPVLPVTSLNHVLQFTERMQPHPTSPVSRAFLSPEQTIPIPGADNNGHASTPERNFMVLLGSHVNALKAMGTWDARHVSCEQQQALTHAEIEMWNVMSKQQHKPDDYRISRRMALTTLATLAPSLLTYIHSGAIPRLVTEEFLAHCATSITACYHLLQEDGLETVAAVLPQYLPLLHTLATTPSPFQSQAASLAAQGSFLSGLMKLHQLAFTDWVHACQSCVSFAHITGDPVLEAAALTHLGNAWFDSGHPQNMLHTYQKAMQVIKNAPGPIPPFVESRIHLGLATASARLQQSSHIAETHLRQAHEFFSRDQTSNVLTLFLDYHASLKILLESFVLVDLGTRAATHPSGSRQAHSCYEQASTTLAQIENMPSSAHNPERIRIEIINQQATVAIKTGHLENFARYFLQGIQGAQRIGSEKRQQEAINNWKAARQKWPHEQRILELEEALHEGAQ
jgi:hypothetical protein